MFDVGFSELLLLAIVALVVIGPEKLPHVARMAGAWVGRIRRTVSTMQAEIEREVAAQEVRATLEKELRNIGGASLVQELQEERQQLEASLRGAAPPQDPLGPDAAPPVAIQADTPPPASLLREAAKPLDEVELDGEQAYRDWLAAQRRKSATSPGDSGQPSS